MSRLARRDFLKATPAAAGFAALTARTTARQRPAPAPPEARISSVHYTPRQDYPTQPQPYWDVRLTDRFWKPRIDINAAVTIPFQIEKVAGTAREINGNVLEAAMLSLRTHPDPRLQATVEAAV